jgi:hypothetical protein
VADDSDLDEKVIDMQRGKFSIREMLAQPVETLAERTPNGEPPPAGAEAEPAEELPPLDDVAPLPGPGDAYKAYARASNKPLPTLVLLLANASARGFSYANLDTLDLLPSGDPGQGPVIVLAFSGITPTEIRLHGRNLDALYVALGAHRTAWIRERSASRDFIPATETVITGIKINKIED